MKKGIIFAGLTSIALLLSGCKFSFDSNKAKYTIMVYMCGADLESGFDGYNVNPQASGLASGDIFEMCSASNKPKDVNIIIETGGAKAWANSKINAKKLQRWHIENGGLVHDEDLPTKASMGAGKTFQSFLEWGLTKYPAQKTGVIMWNHGGAMQGVCFDENFYNEGLLASEVCSAVKGAFESTGRKQKLEWIGYDACLMQVQDIAEANSDYFNYMVAAQESEGGDGWAYNRWLDNLYNGESTKQILTEICDTFVTQYGDHGNDQTLSVLDLSKIGQYKKAWENLATTISSTVSSSNKSDFQNMMKNVKTYGTTYYSSTDIYDMGLSTSPSAADYYGNYGIVHEGNYYVDYGYNSFGIFDVKDFLNKLGTKYTSMKSDIAAVNSAYDDLLLYNRVGDAAGESNGLCLFFPMHKRCSAGIYYSDKQTRLTNWRSLTTTLGEK